MTDRHLLVGACLVVLSVVFGTFTGAVGDFGAHVTGSAGARGPGIHGSSGYGFHGGK